MRTILLTSLLAVATLWLSGCTLVSFEESGRTKKWQVMCTPAQGLVRVVHVPCLPSPDEDGDLE